MGNYLQGRTLHVDQHLTNIAVNYRPTGFVADMIMPMIMVPKQSDMIKVYKQEDQFRQNNTVRAPGAQANKVGFQVSSDFYACKNYALKGEVTIEDRANADAAFIRDLEEGRTEFVMDQLLLDWEIRVASQVTTSTNVSTQFTVGSAWSDYTNSRPLEDMWTAMDEQEDQTAYRPNRIVFSGEAWRYFSRNAQVIDKIHKTGVSGGAMNVTRQQAAQLLEVDEVMVANAYYNTGEEGQALNLSRIWGDNVLMYYTPGRASIDFPSFGYTFRWRRPGLPNMTVERHPFDRKTKTDEIEVGYYQDEKLTSTALGTLVSWTGSSQ